MNKLFAEEHEVSRTLLEARMVANVSKVKQCCP